MKKLIVLATLTLVGSAQAERWNSANDPDYFNYQAKTPMSHSLFQLPLAAKLQDSRLGWSETYWPSNKGGIAYRWNSPNPEPFRYKMNNKEAVLRMSEEELSELSPAELYDIAQGDYKYSLTKKVLSIYSERDLWWEGICHGWSLAASNYPEPDQVVVTNKDGVRVPFGSSDVKGLLAMHDAFNSRGLYTRVGDRCAAYGKVAGEAFPEDGPMPVPTRRAAERPECKDVNAGAFHIVLTNMIGVNSQGFVADIDRFNDVWNQPIVGYESKIVSDVALTGLDLSNRVNRKVRIQTKMYYGDELEFYTPALAKEGTLGFVSKEPVTGTPRQTTSSRDYDYVLELSASGEILGGEWISEGRPDMLWMKRRDETFQNGRFPLAGLNRIYTPVQQK
jgi:Transglutaminase elicitor